MNGIRPTPKLIEREVETQDEQNLKQGKVDEPLELVAFDKACLETTVRIDTEIKPEVRQQLKQLISKQEDIFT